MLIPLLPFIPSSATDLKDRNITDSKLKREESYTTYIRNVNFVPCPSEFYELDTGIKCRSLNKIVEGVKLRDKAK
jgi:hypothetical protein